MESSEDDAGTATSASRRASAREKDVGQAEDVDATSSYHQDINEGRTSCQTPAMSEDNFDGDSVPSPSAQDVNTSTEAILDMIDEIVDGPGAPKRLPLSNFDSTREFLISASSTTSSEDSVKLDVEPDLPPAQLTLPEHSAKSDILDENTSNVQVEDSSLCESVAHEDIAVNVESIPQAVSVVDVDIPVSVESVPISVSVADVDIPVSVESVPIAVSVADVDIPVSVESIPQAVSVPDCKETVLSVLPEPTSAVLLMEPETSVACPSLPSSSVSQNDSEVSECEKTDRTFKSVSSSDNRDNITIEKAESTSSDCIVSETIPPVEVNVVKSPLKRRLIRPPPCDRRPDSTVSSTVDSQTIDVFSNVQSSETITKDVSSSSDAMPIVHGNDKTEEIRNISDVSICKAEASVSPPKKIKLIRPKITLPTPAENSSSNDQQTSSVKEQCQSTSIEDHVRPAADLHEDTSSPIISTSKESELCESSAPALIASELPLEAPLQHEQHAQQETVDAETCRPGSPKRTLEIEHGSPLLNDYIELPTESNVCDSKLQENISDVNDEKHEESSKEMQTICEDDQKTPTLTEENKPVSDPVVPVVDKTEIPPSVNVVSEINIDISTNETVDDSVKENCSTSNETVKQEEEKVSDNQFQEENKKVPPIKLSLTSLPEASTSQVDKEEEKASIIKNESDSIKQIPKLTIRLNNKQTEEIKSPIPKLTIKPIRPPSEEEENIKDQVIAPITKLNIKPISRPTSEVNQVLSSTSTEEDDISKVELFPNVTKINIKPILKPPDTLNDAPIRLHPDVERSNKENTTEGLPCITKLNIKPILKPPEKINDIHRKSSSSEISESECSENDETSTSDQASTSDQGPSDIVPKVTIKLGKPGTISEGKFYTEQNIPKLTIKGLQSNECEDEESTSKLKLIINEPEDTQSEKIPKMTIKTVTKSEGQPLSPKLTIKPLKPPDNITRESETSKTKSHDFLPGSPEIKENVHVPKITIKPITRSESDTASKTPKKSITSSDNAEHIPIVTKLNIKPILKPTESQDIDNVDDKVPVVSKLNIKPVVKPKDNELESSIEDVPKITKLNIKPLRNPEVNSSEPKDCDADTDENSIPVVTKINIKPIVKPIEDVSKDSENQSSETGNSSDDNADIPIVTKLNIKPIVKPVDSEETSKSSISNEHTIPAITKLNIKPLVKPDDSGSAPSSPKKEHLKNPEFRSSTIPIVTKLNIKPVLKPEEKDQVKSKEEIEEKTSKNPPLVMKINRKAMVENADNEDLLHNEHVVCNNVNDVNEPTSDFKASSKQFEVDNSLKVSSGDFHQSSEDYKLNSLHDRIDSEKIDNTFPETSVTHNCVSENTITNYGDKATTMKKTMTTNVITTSDTKAELSGSQTNSSIHETSRIDTSFGSSHSPRVSETSLEVTKVTQVETSEIRGSPKSEMPLNKTPYVQNCKLLKKLLENSRDQLVKRVEDSRNTNCMPFSDKKDPKMVFHKDMLNCSTSLGSPHDPLQVVEYNVRNVNTEASFESDETKSSSADKIIDTNHSTLSYDLIKDANDSLTKPLEINISEKYSGQSSGQDSPRIILKINKTDHGPSAKIITEDIKRSENFQQRFTENTLENLSGRESPRKHIGNSRRKMDSDEPVTLAVGKRLRSSRIVDSTDKSPPIKRNVGKRPSTTEVSPVQSKETELTVLETKRLKLGQLLSGNKSLTQPVVRATQISPTKTGLDNKQVGKVTNHSILNNENCSKNGNSKLHNILSNLQAKQKQSMAMKEATIIDKSQCVGPEVGSDVKTSLSVDIGPIENCHVQVQEMIINENCDLRDHGPAPDASEALQDPLEVAVSKVPSVVISDSIIPPRIEQLATPQPKKRGRPRKLPVSEGAKPAIVTLPTPALEERPQRSLRLTRERPTILTKPRGRGRGRGRRAEISTPSQPETVTVPMDEADDRILRPIDPTSSRLKLPRMTEALDKMPGGCSTPLSSRRRSSGAFSEVELKVVLEATVPKLEEAFAKSPEIIGRGRGGRGSRGGRGRTPRGRGRGRGGGRGAVYMKETMGIYGRVCGPATTTVQLFEEETCMMDDNATPAKSSHLLDEDSQSSVKSLTNESSKMKKSKFSDLFDSNKVWTAADVKEYTWPTQETADALPQVMMIQEQVAMFLGVKSFKRRYPELKRRAIVGEEKDYVLAKGLVTEALCDLGITAVDASEVLDIMLSDYPHKYEEYRSHQRERQLTEPPPEPPVEIKQEEKVPKVEIKVEKPVEQKPELPKIDPEKTRQDMAAAAMASASEWNARANAWRRPACVDLQSLSVHRRRAPPARAPTHLRPPAGFYPHALLPGQYQHCYRLYTPEQLRYFPLNTALVAPPAPPSPAESSSDSEPEWGSRSSSSDDSDSHTHPAKRKKLSKVKRSSQAESKEKEKEKEEVEVSVEDTCRACKLRLEGNRKYTHERFLVCASCNAKLHPSCVELSADTIRKCREYPWQCAECKTCCSCHLPADDDKMLFCDLCDRGFHIYCVGLDAVPNGRWHCVECAVCKSCGAREPAGLAPEAGASPATPAPPAAAPATPAPPGTPAAVWHHQTRRGPGGHKVYSHSLCTPCARAYRIGRYCPLCERSFIGPKGTMQLVICKLCDRQLHQECVRQTVSSLNVLDYTCADCRRGGITSRAAAARLAPRTIATLFMAKRRFNKYAHRQYMRSRMLEAEAAAAERAPSPPAPPSPHSAHMDAADVSDASDGAEPADPADDPLQGAG